MKFGIIGNLAKPGLGEAVDRLIGSLKKHSLEFVVDEEIAKLLKGRSGIATAGREGCVQQADMVVTFGGDGTFLGAARLVGRFAKPILGINLGKLGFLAEVAPQEIEKAVEDLVAKRYVVEERLLLAATSRAISGKVLHAVNDIVLDKSRSSRVVDLETYIDGKFAATFRADGLIVSTPTGSTAYALSSGGPIVIPTSNVIGITPISPHTLSGRPLIVPDTSFIKVLVKGPVDEVLLSADGITEGLSKPPIEVEIRKADYPLRLVKRLDRSYFDVLRAKLFWGSDARA